MKPFEFHRLHMPPEHHHGRIVVLSNHGGPDFQLMGVWPENDGNIPQDINQWDVLVPRRKVQSGVVSLFISCHRIPSSCENYAHVQKFFLPHLFF
eukprot:scaffold297630_cov22-Prasinocladus_malaysianus.AAC.1